MNINNTENSSQQTSPIFNQPIIENKSAIKSNSGNKRILIIIIVIVILVLIGSAGGYIFGIRKNQLSSKNNLNVINPSPSVQISPAISVTANKSQLFSGQVQRLNQNLGLLLISTDFNNPTPAKPDPDVNYYSAGTYVTGKYSGYTRYISILTSGGPGGPIINIFASKDGKTFVLDGEPVDLNSFKQNDSNNPLFSMNKTKVTGIDHLDSEHPAAIPLDSHFALTRNSIIAQVILTDGKDQYGNQKYDTVLVTNFSSYPNLKSPLSNLTFYAQNSMQDITYGALGSTPTGEPSDIYIGGTTKVYVTDSTGLAYAYTLANSEKAQNYPQQMAQYNKGMLAFQSQKTKVLPEYPQQPNLQMAKQDIQTNQPIYNTYNLAIPASCALGGDTLVAKNISDSDLQKIGTSTDGDIYVLTDKNHLLNKKEFDDKITSVVNIDSSTFKQINNGLLPPAYDQYVNQNPLLFIKDYWGRWVILGEFDYHLMGGCGKPVIYLYSTKPTKVSVQFLTPISFDTDIPTYYDGWNVLAQPDGNLTDLQPQFTNCLTINSAKFGSEYAKDACQNNAYPYLYWAGTSTNRPYPVITKGWIVDKSNVSTFMNNTLDTIGFTSKEKSDFLSYWIPKMLSHNTPYYRISFLQNAEMDEIAPMKVNPIPNHYYRYFLDYIPLNAKPSVSIQPQTLNKIQRNGFILVEWGGRLQ